ncbi:MAG TPA: gephyrin-like molybdotransferase Glp [Polyangia bacterium]|nr:gephyrin-like molybdotransferase Glp [Polyangia bacterium]
MSSRWLTLIPPDEARRILAETPPVGAERVPLAAATGRVLAHPFMAPDDLPAERRAVMDGYAVRAADVHTASELSLVVLNVVGGVPMGDVFHGRMAAGEAVAIATGGFLPADADAVVMVEHTEALGGSGDGSGGGARIEVSRAVAAGGNVVQPGEDLARGETVLPAGRRLRPADLALLATFGAVEIDVFRRPRVAVLSTGNELCAPEAIPRPGQVRDANQVALAAQVAACGCQVTAAGIVRDDAEALRAKVTSLLPGHDAVILSGGSSIGTKDLSAEALGDLPPPGILFHGIDIRPGKPTLFARAGGKPVLGMPGFPTSSLVVFDAFIRPLLWRLSGEGARDPWPARRAARLGAAHRSVVGREDYLRVALEERDGALWADPLRGGSATLSNVVRADGLVCVPAAVDHLDAGAAVEVLLYT